MNSNPSPSHAANARSVMNISKSLERMGGDHAILHDLATFFLEDSGQLLATLKTAIAAKESKQAARSAHSLSGLSANFTADRCAALGKSIEESCLNSDFAAAQALLGEFEAEIARLIEAINTEILHEQPRS